MVLQRMPGSLVCSQCLTPYASVINMHGMETVNDSPLCQLVDPFD
jgi:hypothetical protein